MNNHIDYSGFIEKYLNETMEKDELKWFREEMEMNPSLSDEVQMHRDIGDAILNEETLEFRAQISSLFDKREPVSKPETSRAISIPHSVRVAVASFAALIMIGTGLYMYTHRTIPADKLFEMYYEPYDGLMNVRSSNNEVANILVSAMHKYENKEFESALLLFETALATDMNNIPSRFYSGISYMATERFSIAETTFNKVIDQNDNLFIEQAEWYLSLCYLKTGEKGKARELLNTIAKTEGYYSRPARNLARNL